MEFGLKHFWVEIKIQVKSDVSILGVCLNLYDIMAMTMKENDPETCISSVVVVVVVAAAVRPSTPDPLCLLEQ